MADMSIKVKDRLALRIDREIGIQMDTIIDKVIVLARAYYLGENEKTEQSANSPFKNVLNVSVEPSSSLEVIKNFIRYQTGRKGGSEIWKKKGFADALVTDLDKLSQDAGEILQRIKASGEKQADSSDEVSKHPLVQYIDDNGLAIRRDLHLQLVQLYLGYLSREHIASKGGVPGQIEESSTGASEQENKARGAVTQGAVNAVKQGAIKQGSDKGKPSRPQKPKPKGNRQ